MGIYIATYWISILLSSINVSLRSTSKRFSNKLNLFYCIPFIIMAFLVGFRDSFGFDDKMYIQIFQSISYNMDNYRQIEISYILISKIISFLGFNYQAVFLFYSFVSYYFIYKGTILLITDKTQRNLFLSLFFIFIFLDSFVIMRQFLSLAIIFYAYACYSQKKYKKSFILYLLAIFFHNTAVFAIVPIFILKFLNQKSYRQLFLGMFIAYIVQYLPYEIIIENISKYFINYRNNYFVRTFLLNQSQWYSEPLSITLTILLVLYMFSLFLFKKNCNNCKKQNIIFTLGYMYFFSYMILSRLGRINRLSWYFIPFALIAILQFFNYLSCKDYKYFKILFIFSFSVIFIYIAYNYTSTLYDNYIFRQYKFNLSILK